MRDRILIMVTSICGGKSMKVTFLIGRLVFGGFFLYNGINHLKQRKQLGQYAESKNVPLAEAVVAATGVVLIAGGASILLGVKPKLGTAAIAGFLAGVSPVMHNFWSVQEPTQRMNEMINFSKNMALLGSALALMGLDEPWPVSVPISQDEIAARGYEDLIAA
jgi:putative oxidoreductase